MSWTEKLNELYEQLELFILNKVGEIGVESEFNSNVVVKIDEESNLQFNLDGGRYLVEVGCYNLYDNCGHAYDFSVLGYEDLCELVDYLETL